MARKVQPPIEIQLFRYEIQIEHSLVGVGVAQLREEWSIRTFQGQMAARVLGLGKPEGQGIKFASSQKILSIHT